MINIAICDDNVEESTFLESMIQDYGRSKKLSLSISTFENGFLFLDGVTRQHTDLCFLDIYMPGFSGLETAKELRNINRDMHLIFCTSSVEHALDGYGVQASNYLVKPVVKEKLFTAMDEVIRRLEISNEDVFWVPTETGMQGIVQNQIAYIEPDRNHSCLYLRNGTSLACRLSFSELCETLCKNNNFFLIRRSVLLNFDSVVGMEQDQFLLNTGVKIPIPRRKRKDITKIFLDYNMS